MALTAPAAAKKTDEKKLPDDDFDMPEEAEDNDAPISNTGDHADLDRLEKRLREQVDEDFFDDPRKFHALHRVIDVLGAQMDGSKQSNPAYRALQKQQKIVEDTIEYLAVQYCADVNDSVIQVGKVARQFSDAVSMVRHLRRQVRDIKDTLGGSSMNYAQGDTTAAQAAAMSLRELWLKKLECEAVIDLLEKIDVVRAAPAQFDALVAPPCRIGAAVLILSRAFSTAFQSNVAAVQALQNVSAQITDRRQRADQIIWDTLLDVIYLRTGNGVPLAPVQTKKKGSKDIESSAAIDSRNIGLKNPFMTKHRLTLAHTVLDDDDDDDSMESFFSKDSDGAREDEDDAHIPKTVVIPGPLLEAELDLEADEQRCLEETMIASEIGQQLNAFEDEHSYRNLPRYVDHVLALRILVECLAKLGRLDDVQRTLMESLPMEIRKIAQKEQAKTFGRLERTNRKKTGLGRVTELREHRRHLTGLLSSFGCVMIRLSHLAQILRHRIKSDSTIMLPSYQDKNSAMRSVLVAAYDLMQKEIKEFLIPCIRDDTEGDDDEQHRGRRRNATDASDSRGLFTLGITDSPSKKNALSLQPESRAAQMQQSASKFVINVLMPKTNTVPEVGHALEFRRSIAVWSNECDALQLQLGSSTGEDMTAPSFKQHEEERATNFLDDVIKKQLIPVLQHEAINGTTKALERDDAFDPVIDRTVYGRPNSNEPQDVDMCVACQALFKYTGPLFGALHRLPKDEKMYMHLVGVLEHAVLTFISRVKPRVNALCNHKMALRLMLESSSDDKDMTFSLIIEKRRAFSQLLNAYADGELLESSEVDDGDLREPGGNPAAPSSAELKSRTTVDIPSSVEREEQILAQEIAHLKTILEFTSSQSANINCCSDEELMKACCLAHSLLKLSSLLESRLKSRSDTTGFERTLSSTRALREAIKTIKSHGVKMAKFCRIDMLMQVTTRLQKICKSSTIVAKDAVRIPSCVNDLGEYLTGASENLREAGGNAVTAYTFSSLEQYIPLFLMQTVRVIAKGEGIVAKSPLTLNGVEALDRSGSVLYRDLKGATSFDNSYWDDELAAISFERSASLMAMMEVEMEELEAYYRGNHQEFSDEDFELMFAMNGPRRKGDIGRYHLLKKKMRLG